MASRTVFLDSDIVKLRDVQTDAKGRHKLVATLFWGDRVTITRRMAGQDVVKLPRREWNEDTSVHGRTSRHHQAIRREGL